MSKQPGTHQRCLLVELLGPAGAGKTTVANLLETGDRGVVIAARAELRNPRNAVLVARGIAPLLPMIVRHPRAVRRLTSREWKMMIQLNCWLHAIRMTVPRGAGVVLLDHGPLYMLATLQGFGPPVVGVRAFHRWWAATLERWTAALDVVVVIDAPNEILGRRINARATAHVMRGSTEEDARRFLDRYRRSISDVLVAGGGERGAPAVVRTDSAHHSPPEIVSAIEEALAPLR